MHINLNRFKFSEDVLKSIHKYLLTETFHSTIEEFTMLLRSTNIPANDLQSVISSIIDKSSKLKKLSLALDENIFSTEGLNKSHTLPKSLNSLKLGFSGNNMTNEDL